MPLDTVRGWLDRDPGPAVYRFAIESLFPEQDEVGDWSVESVAPLGRAGVDLGQPETVRTVGPRA